MNRSKQIVIIGAAAVLLSNCSYDDYSANGYGDPYQQQGEAYGDSQQSNYGGYDYRQQPAQSGYGGGQTSDYGSESGDVVTYPGDSGGGAPNYGGYGSPSPSSDGSGRTYSVQKGDNLYRIGKKYGVSMQEIIQANGLSNTTIHPGQELIIP